MPFLRLFGDCGSLADVSVCVESTRFVHDREIKICARPPSARVCGFIYCHALHACAQDCDVYPAVDRGEWVYPKEYLTLYTRVHAQNKYVITREARERMAILY